MDSSYRVACLVSHPIQYQAPLFRYLSARPGIDGILDQFREAPPRKAIRTAKCWSASIVAPLTRRAT